MKEYVTHSIIANEIRMAIDTIQGIYVLVEGPTDRAFFRIFIQKKHSIKPCSGKKHVTRALKTINSTHPNRVIGIVDADFWPINKDKPDIHNLFITDTHDVESLVIKSDAFEKTILNCCDFEKIERNFSGKSTDQIRRMILAEVSKIGKIRLANEMHSLGIKFSSLNFEKFVNPDTLQINVEQLVEHIIEESNTTASKEDIMVWVRDEHAASCDPWLIVCGHDMVSFLVTGLNKQLGWKQDYNVDDVEAAMRQAFESRHFQETKLCKELHDWSKENLSESILEPHSLPVSSK